MRVNARSNPPLAPQFSLPSQPPSKCLDISTTRGVPGTTILAATDSLKDDDLEQKSMNLMKKKWSSKSIIVGNNKIAAKMTAINNNHHNDSSELDLKLAPTTTTETTADTCA
jgi:hypothetical protein